MKDIIFSEAMFHATIEGRKTQTRRIVKQQPDLVEDGTPYKRIELSYTYNSGGIELKPRYTVGETVYIKEPYCFDKDLDSIMYKYLSGIYRIKKSIKWIPALLLPAKYARHFIEITGVRCERVQEISDEDCIKEGIVEFDGYHVVDCGHDYDYCYNCGGTGLCNGLGAGLGVIYDCECSYCKDRGKYGIDCKKFTIVKDTPQQAYAALFDKINRKGSFERNPYVFCYSFKLTKNQ